MLDNEAGARVSFVGVSEAVAASGRLRRGRSCGGVFALVSAAA